MTYEYAGEATKSALLEISRYQPGRGDKGDRTTPERAAGHGAAGQGCRTWGAVIEPSLEGLREDIFDQATNRPQEDLLT
jgi:hypothetical protein